MNEDKFCQIIKEEEKISKGEVLGTAIGVPYVGGIHYRAKIGCQQAAGILGIHATGFKLLWDL